MFITPLYVFLPRKELSKFAFILEWRIWVVDSIMNTSADVLAF